MGRPAKPLDRIKLYDHYTFDPTIPQLLRVKTPYGQSKRATGEPVSFYVHQNGYASVSVLGKRYRRSRVIYSLCKGHIPEGMFVDHIDGNRLNDHPDN
ncbi:HNH endonuclease signature motif containing protein, partial [Escherichia coli]|nr:HNH endonuclease [Escherichia coli]